MRLLVLTWRTSAHDPRMIVGIWESVMEAYRLLEASPRNSSFHARDLWTGQEIDLTKVI